MQTTERRIRALREISVCKLGLQMRDEWWLELFEPDDDKYNNADNISFKYSDSESEFTDVDEDEVYSGKKRNNDDDDDKEVTDHDGDDESNSDISDEDFYSDEESGKTKIPDFIRKKKTSSNHWQIKQNLLKSKDKVLSRSLPNVTGTEKTLISASKDLLEERFFKTAAADEEFEMDRAMIERYLASEDEDDDIKQMRDERLQRRTKTVNTISPMVNDVDVDSCSELVKSSTTPPSFVSGMVKRESLRYPGDTFGKHFGEALKQIRNIFKNSSPLKKMQCLTNGLRTVSHKIEQLRMRAYQDGKVDRAKVAVTAEDLLPLLVLLLLKMETHEVAKLYAELLFITDLMADFLSSGVHSYALCEFQIAFRVLDQTCDELEL